MRDRPADRAPGGDPRAQLTVYRGTGHRPHWEQPERAAADLVSFAQRVEPAARAAIAPGA